MTQEEICKVLVDLMREITHNDSLTFGLDATDKDIDGWSSLAHTELIVAIEKHYGFKFSLMDVLSMKKEIASVVSSIEKNIK